MASNRVIARPQLVGKDSSSSSSSSSLGTSSLSASSSLYTPPGMEQPVHSFKSFVESFTTTPKFAWEKPLPPIPPRRRSSFSVSSAMADLPLNSLEPKSQLPSTEFFLQPVAFSYSNPDLSEQRRTTEPSLRPNLNTLHISHEDQIQPSIPGGEAAFLAPKTYSPNLASCFKTSGQQHEISKTSLTQREHDETSKLQTHVIISKNAKTSRSLVSKNLESAPACGCDNENLCRPSSPQRPVIQQLRSLANEHSRSASLEKARVALGLDSKTLKEDAERRKHINFFTRPHYRPTTRSQHILHPLATPGGRHTKTALDFLGDTKVSYEERDADLQAYGIDYHAQLTDQYRSSREASSQRHSGKSASNETELVPAPLFWKRHKRISSGKSTSPEAPKGASLMKTLASSPERKAHSRRRSSESSFYSLKSSAELLSNRDHCALLPQMSSPKSKNDKETSVANNEIQLLGSYNSTEGSNEVKTPPQGRKLFSRDNLMRASPISRPMFDEQNPESVASKTRWLAKRTKSQRRRDELKASIKVVGEVDPNLVRVARDSVKETNAGKGDAARDFGAWRRA